MIGVISMPHRMADPHTVVPPTWLLPEGTILGERIDGWMPRQPLILTALMEVDGPDFAETSGLDQADEIVVCASWRCTSTNVRGAWRSMPTRLDRCDSAFRLQLDLPAGALDVGLALRTTIALRQRHGRDYDETVARRPGSVLWHDHPTGRVIALGSPKFPVAAVDFVTAGYGDAASAWRLLLDASDLRAPVEASVKLLINVSNERLISAVTDGWRDPSAWLIRSMLSFAVQRELVHAALDRINDVVPLDHDEGTLGSVLKGLIAERFPDVDVRALCRERERDPNGFETHLQARLGLLQVAEGA